MTGWMFLFAYKFIFLNSQGDLPVDEFDKQKFCIVFGLIILGEAVVAFCTGYLMFTFSIEVSKKLTSLSKDLLLIISIVQCLTFIRPVISAMIAN